MEFCKSWGFSQPSPGEDSPATTSSLQMPGKREPFEAEAGRWVTKWRSKKMKVPKELRWEFTGSTLGEGGASTSFPRQRQGWGI
jgi:hypothetical protein